MATLNHNPTVVQIYSFQNPVTSTRLKPVVMAGLTYMLYGKFKNDIAVISRFTETPLNGSVWGIRADNKHDYRKKVIEAITSLKVSPPIIEVHQDIYLAVNLAKLLKGCSQVCYIRHSRHLYSKWEKVFLFLRCWYYQRYLKHLACVYVLSDHWKNVFSHRYPRLAAKIHRVYNSYAHLLHYGINPREVNLGPSIPRETKVMFAGRATKEKGYPTFVRGLTIFLQKFLNYKVFIAVPKFTNKKKYGASGARGKLFKILTQGERKNRVVLTEGLLLAEVFRAMQSSNIFVMSSRNEEFGLACLEARLAGCIVVHTGRGALPEVAGEYSYTFNAFKAESLAATLAYIAEHMAEATEKAHLNIAKALRDFDPEAIAKEIDKHRINLLESKG